MNRLSVISALVTASLLGAGTSAAAGKRGAAGSSPRAQELLLEAPEVWGHRVWFAEERGPIADALAEVLARPAFGGYRVIPPAELRALWADVKQGRLPGLPTTCPAPPPPAALAEHLHPDALWARPEVRCQAKRCRLELDVWRRVVGKQGERKDKQVARFSAELPFDEGPVTWAERIRRDGVKAGVGADVGGGMLGMMGSGDPPKLRALAEDVVQSGSWSYELGQDFLQPFAGELLACVPAKNHASDSWMQPFVVEVDTNGHARRCEANHADHLAPPEHRCQCEVVSKMDFRTGASQRRVSFNIRLLVPTRRPEGPRYLRNGYFVEKRADDGTAIMGSGELDIEALSACLDPIERDLGELRIPASFSIGPDGKPTRVKVRWPRSLPAGVATCLDGVLHDARFTCPLSGHAQVTTVLALSVVPL